MKGVTERAVIVDRWQQQQQQQKEKLDERLTTSTKKDVTNELNNKYWFYQSNLENAHERERERAGLLTKKKRDIAWLLVSFVQYMQTALGWLWGRFIILFFLFCFDVCENL